MKRTLQILSLVTIAGLCGCVAVPTSRISGSLGGHPFHMSLPKDATVKKVEVRAETNGTVVINIEEMSVKMNPEVITTTAAGQAAIFGQVAAMVTNVTAAAVGAAVSAAK